MHFNDPQRAVEAAREPTNPSASTEPMDGEPGMSERLRTLASILDAAVESNPARTACWCDTDEVYRVISCLEEMAEEVHSLNARFQQTLL